MSSIQLLELNLKKVVQPVAMCTREETKNGLHDPVIFHKLQEWFNLYSALKLLTYINIVIGYLETRMTPSSTIKMHGSKPTSVAHIVYLGPVSEETV